jgi:hypothetical protein
MYSEGNQSKYTALSSPLAHTIEMWEKLEIVA